MNIKKQRKSLKERLLTSYRIVFVNQDSLKETPSIKFHRLGAWSVLLVFIVLLITANTLIIIHTPLRQYVLGFSEIQLKKEILSLSFEIDSLERKIQSNKLYFQNIQKILKGDWIEDKEKISQNSYNANPIDFQEIKPSKQDSLLRQSVAEEEKFNVFAKAEKKHKITVFFPPIQGEISVFFNDKHLGVDISAKENSPIMAVADGTIIFSEWTLEHQFVIIIEHSLGFTSVYKNIDLPNNIKQGQQIKAGEVIANLSHKEPFEKNPYLHFELWENGYPVNPKNYIQLK